MGPWRSARPGAMARTSVSPHSSRRVNPDARGSNCGSGFVSSSMTGAWFRSVSGCVRSAAGSGGLADRRTRLAIACSLLARWYSRSRCATSIRVSICHDCFRPGRWLAIVRGLAAGCLLDIMPLCSYDSTMSKPIGDQLRRAINNASMSRYELCQRVALDQASMSKFMKRERGLSLETIDRIGRVLGLALVAAPKRRTNRRVTHG